MEIQILIVGVLSIIAIALSIYSCLKKEPFTGNVLAVEDGTNLGLVALNLDKILEGYLEGYLKSGDKIRLDIGKINDYENNDKKYGHFTGYLSWSAGNDSTAWLSPKSDSQKGHRAFATWQQDAIDATALTITKAEHPVHREA